MGAIGIGVSTQDRTYGWADLRRVSRKITKLRQDYQDAKLETVMARHEYDSEVDHGEARLEMLATTDPVEYEAYKERYLANLKDLEKKLSLAESTEYRLYDYLNCPHEFEDFQTRDGDNVNRVCLKCGFRE